MKPTSAAQEVCLVRMFVDHYPVRDWKSYDALLTDSARLVMHLTTRKLVREAVKFCLTEALKDDKIKGTFIARCIEKALDVDVRGKQQ